MIYPDTKRASGRGFKKLFQKKFAKTRKENFRKEKIESPSGPICPCGVEVKNCTVRPSIRPFRGRDASSNLAGGILLSNKKLNSKELIRVVGWVRFKIFFSTSSNF